MVEEKEEEFATIWSTDKSKFNYNFIEGKDVINIQNRRIEAIVDETGVSEVLARSLLVKFGWN